MTNTERGDRGQRIDDLARRRRAVQRLRHIDPNARLEIVTEVRPLPGVKLTPELEHEMEALAAQHRNLLYGDPATKLNDTLERHRALQQLEKRSPLAVLWGFLRRAFTWR